MVAHGHLLPWTAGWRRWRQRPSQPPCSWRRWPRDPAATSFPYVLLCRRSRISLTSCRRGRPRARTPPPTTPRTPEKFVAFEGCWTGRRFLGCAGMFGGSCDFVHWLDEVCPPALSKSLTKLWEMYREIKDARVRDGLDAIESTWKYKDEIAKLKLDLKNAQDEVKKEVGEKQLTLALKAKAEQGLVAARAELKEKKKLDASTSKMHTFLRQKAEKERDVLKQEKRKLEYTVAELLKQKFNLGAKLQKIKDVCDE